MKRALLGPLGGLSLLVAVVTSGCDDSQGAASTAAAALESCNAYCDAYIARACSPSFYAAADECKSTKCLDTSAGSAGCNAALTRRPQRGALRLQLRIEREDRTAFLRRGGGDGTIEARRLLRGFEAIRAAALRKLGRADRCHSLPLE